MTDREAFEAAMRGAPINWDDYELKWLDGEYDRHRARLAWFTWQAARASTKDASELYAPHEADGEDFYHGRSVANWKRLADMGQELAARPMPSTTTEPEMTQLPPLPPMPRQYQGLGRIESTGYTDDQMRAYAEAAIKHERERQETDRDWSEAQDWKGMDGATAFLLINRHADGWGETRAMMEAWLAANARSPSTPVQGD